MSRQTIAAAAIALGPLALSGTQAVAQGGPRAPEPAALSGNVSSTEEGLMEGVLISVKKDGSSITQTVVSDDKGRFSFPASRLSSGHYDLKIRATGYVLAGRVGIDVTDGKIISTDIKLKKTDNIAPQLTNAEWLASMPGADEQKGFLQNCVACHTLQRVVSSTFDSDQFQKIIMKMGTIAPGSMPGRMQMLVPGPAENRTHVTATMLKPTADYLASVNLSKRASWAYPLVTLPRPKGRATHVIITTYDLARKEAMPHDVIPTPDGRIWYSDFGSQYIGELDAKSGKVTDYAIPTLKENEPKGVLDLKPDQDGNLWITMMYQAGLAKFDLKTRKVTTYPVPKEWQTTSTQIGMVAPTFWKVDGKVWTNNQESHSILRLDVRTGKWEDLGILRGPDGVVFNSYDIATKEDNNLYLFDISGARIGRIDAKSTKLTTWTTSLQHSRPRRGGFDKDGKLWFAEFNGNAIGMFDGIAIKEWQLPTKWTLPYEAMRAENGDVWTASMLTDRVTRLNPQTGEFVDYLLPNPTNMRHVSYDKTRNAIWTGSNHGHQIVEIEPLD
jgi:streptogramin lyase